MGYVAEKIEELQRQGDIYTKKIEIERRRHDDLEQKVLRYRDLLQETKKNMGGVNASNEELAMKNKAIRTLENRLEKFLTKYNETRNANKKIREQIQNFRREKVQQQQIREKLDRDLHLKQQQLQTSMKNTQAAYDARDRVLRQIEATKLQAQDRIVEFETRWNEKKQELELDQQLMKDHQPKATAKNAAEDPLKSGFARNLKKESIMQQNSTKAHWSLAKKEVDLKRQRSRVKYFEDALTRIWTETGVGTVEEIVSGFLAAEEQNFSLFNMINQLNTETEAMEVKIHKLTQQILNAKGDDQLSDLNRQKIKAHLEEQIRASQEKARAYELKYTESMAIIDSMKNNIMSIFHKVGCNDEALGQQLASTGVTDINIMHFLGIIEQRIGEIVQMHVLSAMKKEESGGGSDRSSKKHIKAGTRMLALHPQLPTTDEFAESDTEENDDAVKPYSLSELHEKTTAVISKRKDARKSKRTI